MPRSIPFETVCRARSTCRQAASRRLVRTAERSCPGDLSARPWARSATGSSSAEPYPRPVTLPYHAARRVHGAVVVDVSVGTWRAGRS